MSDSKHDGIVNVRAEQAEARLEQSRAEARALNKSKLQAEAARDEALAEVERYKSAWDCDGETHGPWCREWRRLTEERDRLKVAIKEALIHLDCLLGDTDLIHEEDDSPEAEAFKVLFDALKDEGHGEWTDDKTWEE